MSRSSRHRCASAGRRRAPLRSWARAAATVGATLSLIGAMVLLAFPPVPAGATPPTEPVGQIDTAAGGPGLGTVPTGVSEGPSGVAVHGNNVYIADSANGVVRDYNTLSDTLSVLTGNGEGALTGIGGPAAQADVLQPLSVATDSAGDVFILSGKIDQMGESNYEGSLVTEVPAATGTQFGQSMIAGDIYRIAGNGVSGSAGIGGPGQSAQFNGHGIAVDAAGDVFIADTVNVRVLYLPTASCSTSCPYAQGPYTDGDVYQIAGDGSEDYNGDGEQATAAALEDPVKVAVNGAGDVFIADGDLVGENRIREVNTAGVISTLTGGQGAGVATGIGQSAGPVVFADGDLYVADTAHSDIRKIDPATGVETLVAGVGQAGYTGDSALGTANGTLATQAELEFGFGEGMAVDSAGDVFFVQDTPTGEVIRAVAGADETFDGFNFTQGFIYTLAGNGQSGNSGNDGPAPDAEFDSVDQLTFDDEGDLLLADSGNEWVQLVAKNACSSACPYGLSAMAAGFIYSIAGDGSFGYSGDSGPAKSAELSGPQGIAVDPTGDLFIGDTFNNVIREVSPAGTISTFAGSTSGTSGSSGNGGAALSALFDNPTALATDSVGNVYVADVGNDQVRKIGATGSHTVSLFAGTGTTGFTGDGSAATAAELNISGLDDEGTSLAFDSDNDLYISDNGNNRVREVFASGGADFGQSMASGDVYTVAGNGTEGESGDGGPAGTAEILQPQAVMSDASGDVYLFEEGAIREVAGTTGTQWGQSMTAGDIYTIAGNGGTETTGDGGPALSAGFGGVPEMSLDSAGDLYVVDMNTFQFGLREIQHSSPFDITTVTGNGFQSFSGDNGPATSAQLNTPGGTAVDRSGDVFIVDTGNNRIRMKAAATCSSSCPYGLSTTAGDIYTIAGGGAADPSESGIPATTASMSLGFEGNLLSNEAGDVAVDPSGNVLFTDTGDNLVRMVAAADCSSSCPYGLSTLAGDVYTIAGNGTAGDSSNGVVATSAELNGPEGLAVDPAGDVFIADAFDALVFMVAGSDCSSACTLGLSPTTKGDIYAVAGDGTQGALGDGGPATSAELGTSERLAVDPEGDLLIADPSNAEVRMVAATHCTSSCIYGVTPTAVGDIYTIAGDGSEGQDVVQSAPATTAELDEPDDVAVAPDGTMYIGECLGNEVRQVTTAGTISYFAGNGQDFQPVGDGGSPTAAGLSCGVGTPSFQSVTFGTFGMAYDAPRGNLYIADPGNDRVRVTGVPTSVGNTVFTPTSLTGDAATSWGVDFSTSTRGALSGGTSTITLTAPPGTTLPTVAADYTINSVAVTATPTHTAANNVTLTVPSSIAAQSAVAVAISSVTNPPAAGYPAVDSEVTTTSDPQPGLPARGLTFTEAGTIEPPSITASFGASSVPLNGSTSLTFAISNPDTNTQSLTGVAFTDTLPAGLVVSTPNGESGTCGGGTITGAAGSSTISLSGATLSATGSCSFSVNVTGTSAGTKADAVTVSSTNGGTGNTSNANLNVVAPPVITGDFGAASILDNASTSLSFTITNPTANTQSLTGVAFSDALPSGLVVSTPNGASGTCGGGTISDTAGSSTVSLSGATLAVSGSCTFSVNVTGTTLGEKDNSVTVTSTDGGTGNTLTATLDVTITPPSLSTSFGATSVPLAGSTTLNYEIFNPDANTASLTGVAFTDTVPAGLVVATPDGLDGSCGAGTITAVAGSSSVSLSGATIAEETSCAFSVNVTGTAAGTSDNSVSVSSTNGGTGNTSSADLNVVAPPTVSGVFGTTPIAINSSTSLSYTITNPAANTQSLTGVAFSDDLPAGLVVSTPNGESGSCGSGSITGTAGSATVSLSGATLGVGANCTFSINVTGTTLGEKDNSVTVTSTDGGTGNTSTATVDVVVPTAPAAPTSVVAAPGNGTASVSWTAPPSGGEPILSYSVTCSPSGSVTVTGNPPPTSAIITGLTNGTTYTCTVTASNEVGGGPPSAPVHVEPQMMVNPLTCGYRLAALDGGVFDFGCDSFFGSLANNKLNAPIVGIAPTPTGNGYWMVGADGGVFSFGDAGFHGSIAQSKLVAPIVGIAATPDGNGYWLVDGKGDVFNFGSAQPFGSLAGTRLNAPIVGITAAPNGLGYWMVASDGGVFAFGSAAFEGSMGAVRLNAPVVGMAAAPTGNGYWLVASDGGVFAFGSAAFHGSAVGLRLNAPVAGIAPMLDGGGYWLVGGDGGVFSFGDARFFGSMGAIKLNGPISGLI